VFLPLGGLTVVRIGALAGTEPGAGFGSTAVAVPNDPFLIGTTFAAQWFVLDATPGKRLAATEAVTTTYF
jgi:hypothetical protein